METNNYRFRKVDGKYFLSTDHGSFLILSEDEFNQFRKGDIDDTLQEKLLEREILIDDTNMKEAVRLMRQRNLGLFFGVSLHIMVITLRCNMKCVYCHASSAPEARADMDMSKETARKTVDFLFQSPNKSITIEFQGGEPLLNWDVLKEVVEYSQEKNKKAGKNLKLTVVTNMTLMDEEKMDYLISKGVSVCTSLDGPKVVHDANRPYSGGSNHEQVVGWIKRFSDEYKKRGIDGRINALVTLTNKSLSYWKEIVDEYVGLGLEIIHLRFLNNLGVAKGAWGKISYTVEEYLDFWKKAVSYIEELKKKGVKMDESMVDIMMHKIGGETDPGYLDLRSPCGAAIGQLAYNYNGDIYTCDEARMIGEDTFKLGTVLDDEYKDVVTCDKACATVNASINDQYICNACAYKPYCGVCPVCSYVDQGSVIGKVSVSDRCKIYKAQFDWVVKEKFINQDDNNK